MISTLKFCLVFSAVASTALAFFEYDNDGGSIVPSATKQGAHHNANPEMVDAKGNKIVAIGYDSVVKDPCSLHHCAHGKECIVESEGNPMCVCVKSCSEAPGANGQTSDVVCSNQNVTFRSLCHLDQMRCWCRSGGEHAASCTDPKFDRAYLDYYGSCKFMPQCDQYELDDFPRRLREWFMLVMEELATRRLLPDRLQAIVSAGKHKVNEGVLAAVWKFCEMDAHPRNNAVTRRELIPLISQIKSNEHCTDQFIDRCDQNGDHLVTLDEWAICLKYSYDDVTNWLNNCDQLVSIHELRHYYAVL